MLTTEILMYFQNNNIFIIILILFNFNSLVSASNSNTTNSKNEFYKKFSTINVDVQGTYKKHDKKFVYLKIDNSNKLIKINRKYLNNSPTYLSDGEKVALSLPIGRHLIDNEEFLKMTKKIK